MADAPWAPKVLRWHWGIDLEGRAMECSWCSLCGRDCSWGLVLECDGRGSAFFCKTCAKMIGNMVELADVAETAKQRPKVN